MLLQACFHTRLSFAIAGRIVVTSAFHDAVLKSNGHTKFRAAPEFATIVGAPSKSRYVIGFDDILPKLDLESDRRVLVAAKKDPIVRGDSFNCNKEGLEAANGKYIQESEIHVKTSTFDIQYQIGSRTIGNCLTF